MREAYTNSRKKVKKLIWQSKRSFEEELAAKSIKNPKLFWKYVRSKLSTKSGVSPLLNDKDDPNSLQFNDAEKANILQDQLCSIFTKEQSGSRSTLEKRAGMEITNLKIVEEWVKK